MYTLRKHIKTIEDYIEVFNKVNNIDFIKYTIIINNLNKRIKYIKEYLSIPVKKPKKKSFTNILRDGMKFIKE